MLNDEMKRKKMFLASSNGHDATKLKVTMPLRSYHVGQNLAFRRDDAHGRFIAARVDAQNVAHAPSVLCLAQHPVGGGAEVSLSRGDLDLLVR
jgi:hypothetical protein